MTWARLVSITGPVGWAAPAGLSVLRGSKVGIGVGTVLGPEGSMTGGGGGTGVTVGAAAGGVTITGGELGGTAGVAGAIGAIGPPRGGPKSGGGIAPPAGDKLVLVWVLAPLVPATSLSPSPVFPARSAA